MSRDPSTPILKKFARRLKPVPVFVGMIVGFSLMVLVGRWAGKQNLFVSYERNYPLISPEGYFYPSLDNLTELVSHVASKQKILVLVGGNSVLLGVGQKKEQLWTKELQDLLGSDFAVVNLAFRGAYMTDMGALVAQVLSKQYTRLIYVTNEQSPMRMQPPTGSKPYEYLLWQAVASGKLPQNIFGSGAAANPGSEMWSEAALRGYCDYWSHASDLWNYIGYNYAFTVFNFLQYPPEHFFEARKNSEDQTPDNPAIPERFTFREQSMQILRAIFQYSVEKDAKKDFRIKPAVSDAFVRDAKMTFPTWFQPKTLILLTYDAPYFANQLSEDEHAAYEFAFTQGKSWLQKCGYHSVIIGPSLTDADFADRAHLSASGGDKMARDVAPEIRTMAIQLGYLPPASAAQNP
jgi:lysophospholipase L1-like esterase